ncbi:hypothetical protein HAX54_006278, partial [Datura stramonium]|nr:hypothetical protein [Datura stramonium]
RDLARGTVIRRDQYRAKKDDVAPKAIYEVVASVASGGATRMDEDHQSWVVVVLVMLMVTFGDVDGIGGDVGYTPLSKDVRRYEDTPYMLGKCSTACVDTSKVHSCACEYHKCNKNMNLLISKIEALTEAQGETEAVTNKLIFKKGIKPSSRMSEPFSNWCEEEETNSQDTSKCKRKCR